MFCRNEKRQIEENQPHSVKYYRNNCQTPVLGRIFSPRLRLGVDITFAWEQQEQ